MKTNTKGKQVAVVIGATSKWQSDGRNTLLAHGRTVDDSELPVGVRWGVGGAVAQKFAQEGFFTVLTTRKEANASALAQAIREQGGECMIVELDLVSQDSISAAFATIRREAGDPDVLVYNAGYLEGRDLPPDKELLEYIPVEMFVRHSTSRAEGRFSSPRKCCRRCGRKAQARFSSPTTPARCAGRSA
jgi:NAD(P)-dependent dehydrogenase (short-subunit alcohol dehydrogenase family)